MIDDGWWSGWWRLVMVDPISFHQMRRYPSSRERPKNGNKTQEATFTVSTSGCSWDYALPSARWMLGVVSPWPLKIAMDQLSINHHWSSHELTIINPSILVVPGLGHDGPEGAALVCYSLLLLRALNDINILRWLTRSVSRITIMTIITLW